MAQIEFHPRHDEIDRVRGAGVGQVCSHDKAILGSTCCCQLKPYKSLRREIMTFSPVIIFFIIICQAFLYKHINFTLEL